MSEAPPFWWQERDWRSMLLWPAASLYGIAATQAMRFGRRRPVPVPVLCVGNLTVGGAGKTPVAIALARAALATGLNPGFLSRGYGGGVRGVHLVDADHDSARHVGDEPLLLARAAPVAVSPDRPAAAKFLVERGHDFLIMDDGFQSATIAMDYALIVVDARRGIGNGAVIPAGPLRAPVVEQIRHADAVLKLGEGQAADAVVRHAARAGRPLYRARTVPLEPERFAGRRFLAFAGIGEPAKFFDTVRQAGGEIVVARGFADHHPYLAEELDEMMRIADRDGLDIVTTAKDAVRIGTHGRSAEAMSARAMVLGIDIVFEPEGAAAAILEETLRAWRARSA
jgi:tetraacyldisaccharide 4'-kinase